MEHKRALETLIERALHLIGLYKWLLDVYVLDFFVENHWENLPKSWQVSLDTLDPQDFGKLLIGQQIGQVMPLSLLALLKAVKCLSLKREPAQNCRQSDDDSLVNVKLERLHYRKVKLKKRHEICVMAKLVHEVSMETGCDGVVDFGSGLGHLLRMLTYKYELHSAGIEQQSQLTQEASKLDEQFVDYADRYLSTTYTQQRPVHINMQLKSPHQLAQLQLPNMTHFGLVGLHPCGDLGPLLLKCFVHNDNIKFVCIVGCCYMKLTQCGYPMSEFTRGLSHKVSYASMEIASHALEVYTRRLVDGNYDDLKVHAYRAALERMLVQHDTKLRHAQVRSVKHTNKMTFQSYCKQALHKLDIPLPNSEECMAAALSDVLLWRRVVLLYSLRLCVAPLVETLVLADRLLYIRQHGISCEIRPLFDAHISPRNHIIIGRKCMK